MFIDGLTFLPIKNNMAQWYYYNKNGEKVGPISVATLKALVGQGLITRETVIENHAGRSSVAGKVNGLIFPETTLPVVASKPATPLPPLSAEVIVIPRRAPKKNSTPAPATTPPPIPSTQSATVRREMTNQNELFTYFYIDANGQKQGPINDQQLQTLVARGIITPHTPMETDTGYKGMAGQIPGLEFPELMPKEGPEYQYQEEVKHHNSPSKSPISTTRSKQTQLAPEMVPTQLSGTLPTAKNLDTYFRRYSVSAAALSLLTPVAVIMVLPNVQQPTPTTFSISALFFTNFSTWAVCWCLLVYNLWKLIPVGIARTTPGKAVGLCMIPFYSYYWVFVSVLGLCKDMNITLRQHGIRHRVNEGLGMIYCIFFATSFLARLPILGFLFSLASCTIGIMLFKSLVDNGIALLEQKDVPTSSFSNVKATIPQTTPSGRCADCNVVTKDGEFLAFCLPGDIRQGKENLCPTCVEKYTIHCPKCRLDWRVCVEKGLFDCPICHLAQAVGCTDTLHVLCQSEAFLSRIPNMSSKEDIVMVVGAIYRRGHPLYLDPMGGFLALTKTGCYFLGPIDPDAPEMGYRDIFMPFVSISTVSALGDGVHAQKNKSRQDFSDGLAAVAEAAYSAAKTIPILASFVRQDGTSGSPPPKGRLTIGYRDAGRVNAVFDIMDVSNEKIEETAVDFRKRLMKFAPEFGVVQKMEKPITSQPAGEKYRIFRDGNLLGMITSQEIETKYVAKILQQTDFVLLPLETFLAEIETANVGFQYYRDGKRIDQYTLQQVKELHASGQTQPIDHVLLPMQVFLDRKSS